MNVAFNNIDEVNGKITISLEKADYAEKVASSLKTYRQKAQMPGFRKGMVPLSLVQKMYGKAAKREEILELVQEQLYKYLKDNKVKYLAQPIGQDLAENAFEADNFEMSFDIALAPKFEIKVDKDLKMTYYNIEVDDKMVDDHIENLLVSYGSDIEVDEIADNDLVKGIIVELDEENKPKDGGIRKEGASILPKTIKNEDERAKFIGANKNSVVIFEPYKAADGNAYEITSLLGIDRLQVESTKDVKFSFEIDSISRREKAEMNEEFFQSVFGSESEIKDEASLRETLKKSFAEQLIPNSDYLFMLQFMNQMRASAGKLNYPDVFLKRFLKLQNEKITEEEIEKQYPAMLTDLTNEIIKSELAEMYDIKVEESEVFDLAKVAAKNQFAQYGMTTVPDEMIENFAKKLVSEQNSGRSLYNRAIDNKIAAAVKPLVSLEEKTVSLDEFNKIAEEANSVSAE